MKTPITKLKTELTTLLKQQNQLEKKTTAIQAVIDEFQAYEDKVAETLSSLTSPAPARKPRKPRRKPNPNRMPADEVRSRIFTYLNRCKNGAAPITIFNKAIEPHTSNADLSRGVGNTGVYLIHARICATLSYLVKKGYVKKAGSAAKKDVKYSLTVKGRKHYKATKA